MFQRAPVPAGYQAGVHGADPVVKRGKGVISYQQDRVHLPFVNIQFNELTHVIIHFFLIEICIYIV